MNPIGRGLLIATAAAALVAGGSVEARATDKKAEDSVRCFGVNECKGHGACDTARHDCAGKNACKGEGWVSLASADECKEKGGTLEEKK